MSMITVTTVTTIRQYGLLALVGKRSGKLFREMGWDWHSSGRDRSMQKDKEVLSLIKQTAIPQLRDFRR